MPTITNTQKINPNDLLVDLNVRDDLNLSKEFVASIAEHGVLSPIVAVQTDQGLRVRMGHRRTAAAVQVGLDTVPVVIIATNHDGEAETIERLLTQHAENTHRAGLTTGENVKIAHQLSLLGLSPSQIAKKTQTKKATIETSLQVAGSDLATKAADRYDLTLDQAAAISEFEDDTEAVKALVAAATTGRFEHVAARLRQDRARAEAQTPVITALTEQGVTVIEAPGYSTTACSLNRLRDAEGNTIDPEAHATCPGHAAFLTERTVYTGPDGERLETNEWGDPTWPDEGTAMDPDEAEARWQQITESTEWVPTYACTDPAANGHTEPWAAPTTHSDKPEKSDEQREAERAARRLVIEHNKAWKAAREVRQQWVREYLTRKTLPTQAGGFLAVAITQDADLVADVGANDQAADWFGADHSGYGRSTALIDLANAAADKRGLVITLGAVLAGYEKRSIDSAWRENGDHSPTGRYLRFLATLGYTLSEVEEYAASDSTV